MGCRGWQDSVEGVGSQWRALKVGGCVLNKRRGVRFFVWSDLIKACKCVPNERDAAKSSGVKRANRVQWKKPCMYFQCFFKH